MDRENFFEWLYTCNTKFDIVFDDVGYINISFRNIIETECKDEEVDDEC